MVDSTEKVAIEPKVLAQLAQRALQETKGSKNPCIRALMARLAYVALELKAALENEASS